MPIAEGMVRQAHHQRPSRRTPQHLPRTRRKAKLVLLSHVAHHHRSRSTHHLKEAQVHTAVDAALVEEAAGEAEVAEVHATPVASRR